MQAKVLQISGREDPTGAGVAMNRKTLQALKDSIEKWRQIERGEMVDLGSANCSLCLSALDGHGLVDCKSCPVKLKTGEGSCAGTPYDEWSIAIWDRQAHDRVADTPKLVRLARAERKFLESLLPKGKT